MPLLFQANQIKLSNYKRTFSPFCFCLNMLVQWCLGEPWVNCTDFSNNSLETFLQHRRAVGILKRLTGRRIHVSLLFLKLVCKHKYALLLNKYTAMVFKTAQLLSLVLHMWHIGLFPWTTIRINLKLLTAPWSTVWILSWSLHRVRLKPFCRLIYSSWKLVLSKIKQSRHFIRSNDHHCLWYACFITWPKIQIRLKAIPHGSAG